MLTIQTAKKKTSKPIGSQQYTLMKLNKAHWGSQKEMHVLLTQTIPTYISTIP